MKKWLSLGLIVLAIIGAVYVFNGLFLNQEKVAQIESIVPQEAVYYIYSYNVKSKLEKFSDSKLWQKISSLPIYKTYIGSHLDKINGKTILFAKHFSKECAFAMFSSKAVMVESDKNILRARPGKFSFFCRVGPKMDVLKAFGDLYLDIFARKETEHLKHRGIRITNYRLLNEERGINVLLSYVILGDMFVLGNDLNFIKKSIDLYKGKSEKSLSESPFFVKVLDKYGKNRKNVLLWCYTNYKNYYKGILSETAKSNLRNEEFGIEKGIEFANLRKFMESFIVLSIGRISLIDYDKSEEGLTCKTYQFFDPQNDKKRFLDIFSLSGKLGDDFSKFVSRDTLGYYRLSGDLNKYWRYVKIFASSQKLDINTDVFRFPQYRLGSTLGVWNFLRNIEKFLETDLASSVLPLLDKNVGVIFSDLEEVYFTSSKGKMSFAQMLSYPLPHLSLFAQAKSEKQALKLKSMVVQKSFSSLKKMSKEWLVEDDKEAVEEEVKLFSEKYKDIDIAIIKIKKFPLNPNCFILGNYLVVSPSIEFAKKTIDMYKNSKNSLARSFNEKSVFFPNSYILYLDFSGTVKKLTQTNLFSFFRSGVPMFSKGIFSTKDIDIIVDILGDIKLITQSYKMSKTGVGESLFFIKFKGL